LRGYLNNMRRWWLILLVPALVACGKAPQSGETSLETHRGQWVLVNYWAKWCKPCIKEIPELNTLDQSRADVTVLGVNYDGLVGEELLQQLEELKVAFANLPNDPSAQLGVPRPVVLPTTFILDPQGTIVSTLVGPQTLETLEQALVDAGAPAG